MRKYNTAPILICYALYVVIGLGLLEDNYKAGLVFIAAAIFIAAATIIVALETDNEGK